MKGNSAPKTAKSTTAAGAASAAASSVKVAAATPAKQPPTYEEIARRSYELYLARGSQPGHAEEDWLAAERELGA